MQDNLRTSLFCQDGPSIDGIPLFKKSGGKFVLISSTRLVDNRFRRVLEKIATALNTRNFAEAAIRFAYIEYSIAIQDAAALIKANLIHPNRGTPTANGLKQTVRSLPRLTQTELRAWATARLSNNFVLQKQRTHFQQEITASNFSERLTHVWIATDAWE